MKSLSILVLLSIISTFQYSFASVAALRRTEAGSCTNCLASNSEARRPQGLSSLAEQVQSIAYYTDNGDRQALAALRAKNPSSLTMEEKAILEASNRIGYLHLPACKGANNAILININGRDAVVASGHVLTDKSGALKCSATEDAFYYPNASYLNQSAGIPSEESFIMRKIKLEPNPVNFENHASFKADIEQDFIIYFLTENISRETLPNGTYNSGRIRGSMPISTIRQRTGIAYVIGFDGRYEEQHGRQMSYQHCQYQQNTRRLGGLSHTCDISPGASGSLVGTIENGEMTLQAINSAGTDTYNAPVPEHTGMWNSAISSDIVIKSVPGN